MSAGAYNWQQMAPQMQGMPYLPPDAYAGMRNAPLTRLQMESPAGMNPNFSMLGGMAGPAQFAWQMLLNPASPTSLLAGPMRDRGMIMGPGAGSPVSYALFMRQQQDMMQLRQATAQFDQQRIRRVVGGMVNAATVGQKGNKAGAIDDLSAGYQNLINSPMGQMLGLEDYLVPGGMSSSFAQRMYLSGMRARPAPGRFGLSVTEVADITKSMEAKAAPGGIVDMGFTRGFSMRQLGDVAMGMSERGIMKFTGGKDKIVKQISDMTGALDAMKDLMGTPDAPVQELMQALDDMFGGGLHAIPTARLEQMVTNAQALGRTMNLTSDTMQMLYKQGANQARGYGLYSQLGALTMGEALTYAEGGRNVAEGGGVSSRIRLGLLTPEQRIATAQDLMLRSTGSEFGNRLGAMMHMYRISGGKFGDAGVKPILDKIAAGRTLTAAETATITEQTRGGNLFKQASAAGFTGEGYNAIVQNRQLTQEEIANYNLNQYTMPAMMAEGQRRVVSYLRGREPLTRAGIKTKAQTEAFMQYIMSARDPSEEGLRRHLAAFSGFKGRKMSEAQLGEIYAMVRSGARDTGLTGPDGRPLELETMLEFGGTAAAGRRAEVRARTSLESAMDISFRRAGIGRGPGGFAGIFQNFVRQVAQAEPGADITKMALGAFGAVSGKELGVALGTGPAKGALDSVRRDMVEIEKLVKRIQEIEKDTGMSEEDRAEKLETIRKEQEGYEASLKASMDVLGRYGAIINPEMAQAIDAGQLSAIRYGSLMGAGGNLQQKIEAITGFGDVLKGEQVTDIKQLGKDKKRLSLLEEKRTDLMTKREKILEEMAAAKTPEAKAQKADELLALMEDYEKQRASILKEAAKEGITEGLKEAEKAKTEDKGKDQAAKDATDAAKSDKTDEGRDKSAKGAKTKRTSGKTYDGNTGMEKSRSETTETPSSTQATSS